MEKPTFRFIVSKKLNFKDALHISITKFNVKLEDKTIINIKAYDELAEYCFQNLKQGDFINVCGRLENNDSLEISIEEIT